MNRSISNLFSTTLFGLVLVFFPGSALPGESDTPEKVDASGKVEAALEDLPAEVLATALAKRPELQVTEAEYETRNGNEYYDVGGVMPDGSEIELDMTRVDGAWTVVEVQRDISLDEAPAAVSTTLKEEHPNFNAERIIESDQGDGLVIFEFFGPGPDGDQIKIEISYEDGAAELLADEWVH